MSELTLTVLRLGFLALLWTFVLTLAGVMRTDLFGPGATRHKGSNKRAGRTETTAYPEAEVWTPRSRSISHRGRRFFGWNFDHTRHDTHHDRAFR